MPPPNSVTPILNSLVVDVSIVIIHPLMKRNDDTHEKLFWNVIQVRSKPNFVILKVIRKKMIEMRIIPCIPIPMEGWGLLIHNR